MIIFQDETKCVNGNPARTTLSTAFTFLAEIGVVTLQEPSSIPSLHGKIFKLGAVLEIVKYSSNRNDLKKRDFITAVLCKLTGFASDLVNVAALLSKIRDKKAKVDGSRGSKRNSLLQEEFEIPLLKPDMPKKTVKETDVFEQVSYDLYVEELDRRQKNEENFTQELGKMQQKVVDHRKRATTWYNTSKVQKRRIDRMQHTLQNIRKREADSEAKKQVAMRKKEILSLKKELRIMHSKEKRSVAQELGKQKKELKKKEKEREKLMAALEDTVNEGKEVIANLRSENVDLVRECAELNAENTLLKQSVDFLQSLLQENVPLHLKSRDGQGEGFTPETIHCVMDLLKTGVSSSQVKGVISTVAKLCRRKVTIDQLPSRSSVDNIRIRALAVAQTQLADLASEDNMTLYTDETTKKGTKVMAYGITTKNKETKVLGIKQMVTKSAKDTLDTLCKVVQEVTDACQIQGVGDRIITNIKNTMSDRASTEKLFNSILHEYRSDLLPQIDANFSKMSDDAQFLLWATLNGFLCRQFLYSNKQIRL